MKYVEILAVQTRVKHWSFFYDHHHLICPWAFSPEQIQHRNSLLTLSHWREFDASQ